MISIVILGSGNVAQHLINAVMKSDGLQLLQVFARNPESISGLIPYDKITSSFETILDADLYLISVSDNAISEVSISLKFKNKLVAHTSGSFSIDDLDSRNRKAVFYPLQTFSKNKEINFREVPICLESQNESDFKILEKVAYCISDKVFTINSSQRKSLHVSAVFVSNFVNHLYSIGNDICKENEVDFDILKPLIQETAHKILSLAPNEAQTGPAKRNDTLTINSHLQFISDENQKETYKMLTKSIIDNGKKL